MLRRGVRSSSLPLLMKCTGASVLPCIEGKSEQAERAADWGTMVHHWAQTGEVVGPDTRTQNAFKLAILQSGISRAEYWPDGVHEGPVSVSVDGSRQASWDDTERDGWVTGHYDFRWWLFDELWVDDLKTGKFYPNPPAGVEGHHPGLEVGANRYPQDVRSPQLKTYALALTKLLGYQGRTNVTLTHWPRLPLVMRHSLPQRFYVKYEVGELDEHWRGLELMYQEHQHNRRALLGHEDELILRPGDHCKFCPVRDCFVRHTEER